MDPPRFLLFRSRPLPARPAQHCAGMDTAVGHLVPPPLPLGRPDFFDPAVATVHDNVDVEPRHRPIDAVVAAKDLLIGRNRSGRRQCIVGAGIDVGERLCAQETLLRQSLPLAAWMGHVSVRWGAGILSNAIWWDTASSRAGAKVGTQPAYLKWHSARHARKRRPGWNRAGHVRAEGARGRMSGDIRPLFFVRRFQIGMRPTGTTLLDHGRSGGIGPIRIDMWCREGPGSPGRRKHIAPKIKVPTPDGERNRGDPDFPAGGRRCIP